MARAGKAPVIRDNNSIFLENLASIPAQKSLLIETKHQQIVDGACKVFFQKGYHPTTTRDIAKACDMSIGQLYHYISSKDDVLYLVHKHMQKIWYNYLKKSEVEQIKDPLKRLTKALHHSLHFMVENKKLVQFVYSESKYLDKKYLNIVLDMDYQNVVGFWRDLIKEVGRKKPIKGDLQFISSVIAYLLAFMALRGWTLKRMPPKKHRDGLVDFILRGLGVAAL
jgi:AcrR family transcriptional regulator